MKVVLFCGGLGLRMRGAAADGLPKPMVPLGRRPLLWHVMRYYAHWGHKDFILCLGHGGAAIADYFAAERQGRRPSAPDDAAPVRGLFASGAADGDTRDWRVTLVDTGVEANIGERLLAVRPHLRNEEIFLANYADGLTDHPLPRLVETVRSRGAIGGFLATRPNISLHFVEQDVDGAVRRIVPVEETAHRVNGGFFAFRQEIFDHIGPGEDLVAEPLGRLIEQRLLIAERFDGFWRCCDTFKDLLILEGMLARGPAPWELWRRPPQQPSDGSGHGPEQQSSPRCRIRSGAAPQPANG